MQKDFWIERWENQQIGFHQDEINPHLESLWATLNVKKEGRVFVPLCGKSSDLLWLAKKGHQVVGVELSELAINAFFEEQKLQYEVEQIGKLKSFSSGFITIMQGDFFDLDVSIIGPIAATFDRAALIALPQDMRTKYSKHLLEITNSAPMLLITMEYDQSQMDGPPFAVPESEIKSAYQEAYEIKILETIDLLAISPQFKQRGLESLIEKVYILSSRTR